MKLSILILFLLTNASYKVDNTVNTQIGVFSENSITYDLNGNIQFLNRNSGLLTATTTDQLTYNYGLNGGNQLMKVYSREYSEKYHSDLNGQVERRMQAAIIAVGSIWYTAWANAGMPDLLNENTSEIEIPIEHNKGNTDSTKVYMKKRECD